MPAGYETKFSGDDRELQRAYTRLEKAAQRQADELRKLRNESDRGGEAAKAAGKKQVGAFDAARREARRLETQIKNTRLSGGVVDPGDLARLKDLRKSIDDAAKGLSHAERKNSDASDGFLKSQAIISGTRKAYDVFNDVLETHAELADKSRTQILDLAAAQQEATKNFAGSSTQVKRELMEKVAPDIMIEAGVKDAASVINALQESASTSAPINEIISAVTLASQLNRHTPEKITGLSAAILDLKKSMGDVGFKELGGFQVTSGKVNRVFDPDLLTRALAPTVGSAIALVGAEQGTELTQPQRETIAKQTSALLGELSQRMVDKTGERSSQATVALIEQMGSFLKETNKVRRENNLEEIVISPDLFKTMGLFKKGGEFHEEFFENASFDRKAKAHVQKILSGDVDEDLRAKASEVKLDPGAIETLLREIGGATASLKLATQASQLEASINKAAAFTGEGKMLAISAVARQGLEAANERRGLLGTGLGKRITGLKDSVAFMQGGPVAQVERIQAEWGRYTTSVLARENPLMSFLTSAMGTPALDLSQNPQAMESLAKEYLSQEGLTKGEREKVEFTMEQFRVFTELRDDIRTIASKQNGGAGAAIAARGE